MGHLKTSASFYYRGVPKRATNYGSIVLGNYSIVKPSRTYPGIGSLLKNSMNSVIINNR